MKKINWRKVRAAVVVVPYLVLHVLMLAMLMFTWGPRKGFSIYRAVADAGAEEGDYFRDMEDLARG